MTVVSFPMLGMILPFAGDYPPEGWAFCRGQVLAAEDYPALFYLLRDTYGGDGETTFALPDLVGRAPVGAGVGADGFVMPLGRVTDPAPVSGSSATRGPSPRGALAVNWIVCVEGYFPPPSEDGSDTELEADADATEGEAEPETSSGGFDRRW